MACSQYTACTDCTDNGKTSPNVCQFCGNVDGGVGVCQSLHLVDGNSSSGVRACAIEFDQRATSIAGCSARLPATTTAAGSVTATEVVENVDVRSVLQLGANETKPMVDVTLAGGVRLQVRVIGEEGATLRGLGDSEGGGIGIQSPSNSGAQVRAGLAIEFAFAKDRPVSFRRLVLGAWDDTDMAQLELSNPSSERKRQSGGEAGSVIVISDAETTFDKDTEAGFTRYVLSAVGESEFSLKSFQFVTRGGAQDISTATSSSDDDVIGDRDATGFQFDTMTIALIAAGGAVCLILFIVLVVCVARRRKRNKASNESGSDSSGGNEMRPALGGSEFTLASTTDLSSSNAPQGNYQQLGVVPKNDYRYSQLRASPFPSSGQAPSEGSVSTSYQALPNNAFNMEIVAHPYTPAALTAVEGVPYAPTPAAPPYADVPVSRPYDIVDGGEGFANAIAGTAPPPHGLPPPPPRSMYQ
jgi:hypothetical protein